MQHLMIPIGWLSLLQGELDHLMLKDWGISSLVSRHRLVPFGVFPYEALGRLEY